VELEKSIVATYDYTDQSGKLLFQVVRFETKDFRQRRPDGKGGWTWNLDGVKRVPYRLPELLRSSTQDWVLIAEGEKDCDRLCELGFVATTCPMGAGKWREEYSGHFQGRLVAVLPENDQVGQEHAEQVANALYGTAAEIRIVELPGLPEKGDVSDWFDAGHGARELVEVIDTTQPFTPAEVSATPARLMKDVGPKSQATLLVDLTSNVELFHDAEGNAFATMPVGTHKETWPVKSRRFRQWLAGRFWRECRRAPGAQAMQDALGVLASKATYEGPELVTNVRLAECDGAIWLDLANADWQAVKITPAGWQGVSQPPVKFLRPRGLLPMPAPIRGGSADLLRPFLNLAGDQDWALLISWIAAASRPTGPFPILVVNGEQGSAKSTLCRFVRALVDPNKAPLRAMPREVRDLMIAASNSWILAFDNISNIPAWLSDSFCRMATGGGFATRELYSDNDEVIIDVQRPVMINGIEELANRSDLLDRAICLTLPTIPDTDRKTEKQLWAEFGRLWPLILGALLDAVSKGMAKLPAVGLTTLPRMADFATWSVATEEALGLAPGSFLAAYGSNREDATVLAIEVSPIGPAIQEFVSDRGYWDGTAQELLTSLEDNHCTEQTKNRRDWPKTPQAIGKALRRLAPDLRSAGIDIRFTRSAGKGRKRTIQLEKLDNLPSEMSEPSEQDRDNVKEKGVSDMLDVSDSSFRSESNPPQLVRAGEVKDTQDK
jgi:hypothetical protein